MLEQKVLDTIKKYNQIKEGDSIVVGVSGGPDSICLLNLLNNFRKKLNIKIYVAHINHMIRKNAINDEKFVENYCNKNDIPFFAKRVDVEKLAKDKKLSEEEAGRKVRYSFFNEVALKTNSNKIATAHTSNDNAETILMNIFRGSGISGLKGIQPVRENKYIRPLIDCTRDEIEKYCIDNKLNPCIDETNKEIIYTRNKIRNILIPMIKETYNPNIIKTLNRLSNIAAEQTEYFNNITIEKYNEILILEKKDEIVLDLKKFNNIERVIKKYIIIYIIYKLFGSTQGIEKVHIDDIIKLCEKNIGNKFLMPNKNFKVLIKNKKIICTKR